jgi:hypothetical protein
VAEHPAEHLEFVRFVCFDEATLAVYRHCLDQLG